MSSSRGKASAAEKGKSVVGDSTPPPPHLADYDDDYEVTAPINPNVQQVHTAESIHPPTEDEKLENLKSEIWLHFNRVAKPDRGPKSYDLTCKHCGKTYHFIGGQGYGTYRRHLKSKHPTELGIDKTQQQISRYATSDPLFRFDDTRYKKEFSKFVAVEHLPYMFGEKCGFQNFVTNACVPQAKRIPRNTVKRTINNLFKEEKNKLVNIFINLNCCVHIGSDIWSDHWQTNSYMGVTCHWVDNDFVIQKRVIAFRLFEDRHTAINIYKLLSQILEEYCLVNKVFSIGFDNAAANTASIEELQDICQPSFGGKFFHVRCACHVLNLCVQDGLRTLDAYISPIKNAIQYLWRHNQLMKEWGKFCKINGRRPRKFSKDVPTRWNSTYELLNESVPYCDLLSKFINDNVPNLTLFPQQWDVCKIILGILKNFNDATFTLSGVYYPTSHLFIIECLNIAYIFQQYEDNDVLKGTIENMRNKWLIYYKKIPIIYLVACFFDPRSKIDGLVEYLNDYYKCLNLLDDPQINIRNIEIEVKDTILDLYNEYSRKYNLGSFVASSNTTTIDMTTLSRGQQLLLQRQNKKQKGTVNSEIDDYLTTSFEFLTTNETHFPILDWWKKHATQYPILAIIAKQLLSTPCSTVAVEQAFSAGGNILDERRSRLTPANLEAQACYADWVKAENRQQEIDRSNNEFFNDEGDDTTTTTGSDD